jgi:hypothetical protein
MWFVPVAAELRGITLKIKSLFGNSGNTTVLNIRHDKITKGKNQKAKMKTIQISDKLYDRLVNTDCCGFGMDEIIEQGLNLREAFVKESKLEHQRKIQSKGEKQP